MRAADQSRQFFGTPTRAAVPAPLIGREYSAAILPAAVEASASCLAKKGAAFDWLGPMESVLDSWAPGR